MDINIPPEQINKLISDAILNSTIGELVKTEVQKAVKSLSQSYNNPMESVIKQEITVIIQKVLRDDYTKIIEEKLKAQLATLITDDFVTRLTNKALEQVMSRSW